jgi:hypothetical protein
MRLDGPLKATLVLGAVLALPVLRGVSDGTIAPDAAALRLAMALALAYAGVQLVVRVVTSYLPEPEPDAPAPGALPDGVEDAVIVEDGEVAGA